jgi:NtrC-family two-component system sensor histidine kinase KinB
MLKFLEYMNRQSRLYQMSFGLALSVLLSLFDYLTGPEISFSIFYLIPISMIAWLAGRRCGIVMSATSAALWLIADLSAGRSYSHLAIPYWNAAVRLGFFLIVTFAVSALRNAQERREELAQFIVHDLRAPLSNVMTGLQALQEIGGEAQDETQQNLIEMCLVSCNRMLTLINSLLDLAQLESGRMALAQSDVVAKELVSASLQQVTVWAGRNRVTLASHLDPEAGRVYVDPMMTVRILVNLLSNAIKFSKPGSVVTVRVEPAGANKIAFSVIDQGQGIPQAWAGKVFDKFVQVETRKAARSVGSGLGLTFCRLAVEAQGGRIWLKSEEGKGTTVTFTLPESDREAS